MGRPTVPPLSLSNGTVTTTIAARFTPEIRSNRPVMAFHCTLRGGWSPARRLTTSSTRWRSTRCSPYVSTNAIPFSSALARDKRQTATRIAARQGLTAGSPFQYDADNRGLFLRRSSRSTTSRRRTSAASDRRFVVSLIRSAAVDVELIDFAKLDPLRVALVGAVVHEGKQAPIPNADELGRHQRDAGGLADGFSVHAQEREVLDSVTGPRDHHLEIARPIKGNDLQMQIGHAAEVLHFYPEEGCY